MRLKRVSTFSKAVTKDLLPTQQATIAQVVCGMLVTQSMLLAEIARHVETTVAFAHNLKRVFRVADNERLSRRPDPLKPDAERTAQEKVARRTIHNLCRRQRIAPHMPCEIILDWTSVGHFQVLSALIGIEGRAVPILQWSVRKWDLKKSQNAFEYDMIRCLRRCIPGAVTTVIVADRGFGRTALFTFLE